MIESLGDLFRASTRLAQCEASGDDTTCSAQIDEFSAAGRAADEVAARKPAAADVVLIDGVSLADGLGAVFDDGAALAHAHRVLAACFSSQIDGACTDEQAQLALVARRAREDAQSLLDPLCSDDAVEVTCRL